MLVSSLFGFHTSRSLGYVMVFLFTFLGYFYLPSLLIREMGPKKILPMYFVSFVLIGLYGFSQVLFSKVGLILPFVTQYAAHMARGQGLCYEPSYYALYMTAFVMFFNAMRLYRTDKPIGWFSFLGVNLLLIASTSTGVIFSYPLFIFLYLLTAFVPCTKRHVTAVFKRTFVMFVFFITLMLGLLVLFPEDFLITFYKFFDLGFTKHWSITIRFQGIVNALSVFFDHMFFGVGVGGVGPYLFDQFHHGAIAEGLTEVEIYDPTNAATELLASLGLIGLIGYVLLGARVWMVFKRSLEQSMQVSNEERKMAIALMLSLICSLCVLQFNQGLFRSYVWLHAGICFGYFQYLAERKNI